MGVSYKKLWKMLIDKDLTKTQFAKLADISPMTLAKLGKNEDVSMKILQKMCKTLECDIGDIVEYVPDDEG